MKKKRMTICMIVVTWISCFSLPTAMGRTPIFYDQEKQAIGIDPYFDGWGGSDIYVDFNRDHSSGGFIFQYASSPINGGRTDFGVYNMPFPTVCNYYYNSNTSEFYELHVATNVTADVTSASQFGGDTIRYFVEEWNYAESLTTIYLQPIDTAGSAVPVLESDLQNVYYQIGPWLYDIPSDNWLTIPEPATLLLLGLGGLGLLRKNK